jgi:putative membrane protein
MSGFRMQFMAAAVLAAMFAGSAVLAQDVTSADKKFLADSAQGNIAEVNLAKLALQKSQDKNVREFATRMIKDHEMLQSEMKPLARKLGVKEPTGPPLGDHAKYMELKMKSGTDFDRAYVETMVKDHHDDLQAFMNEENTTTNPELKTAVGKGLSVIKQHTEMIDNIAHMGGIETPPMPAGV